MSKLKSINKNTMCLLNVVLGITAVAVFMSVLQGSSMPSLVVKELAIGSLFTGVLNVFLISFIGLLGKSNTTLQIWRVVQPNVPTINVVVDMVAPPAQDCQDNRRRGGCKSITVSLF